MSLTQPWRRSLSSHNKSTCRTNMSQWHASYLALTFFSTWVLLITMMATTASFQVVPKCPRRFLNRPPLKSFLSDRESETNESRRSIVFKLSTLPLLWSSPAIAAPPVTTGEADGLGARAERALGPKPPKILRPKLNQDFAVLLMRSSYNALDKIDCVAMVRPATSFILATCLLGVLLRNSSPCIDAIITGSISKRLFPYSTSRVRTICQCIRAGHCATRDFGRSLLF